MGLFSPTNDESYIYVADLATGLVVFGGLGWAAGTYWLDATWPIGVGLVAGIAVGVAMMAIRYRNESQGEHAKDSILRNGMRHAQAQRAAHQRERQAHFDATDRYERAISPAFQAKHGSPDEDLPETAQEESHGPD